MMSIANPIPAERIGLVVFDLDGTLIDSRRDLATAVNAMLGEMGRPALPDKVVAEYVGDGAGMLVRRALGDPEDEELVEQGVERFLACYRKHMLDHTFVYDGVFEALDGLRRIPSGAKAPLSSGGSTDGLKPVPFKNCERKFAVLTNKPVNPARRICESLGLSEHFFQIYGGNSFGTKKPDPEGLRVLMREAGASPGETVMVGDSVVDVLTARNAGTFVIGCRYGLSSHTLETVTADSMVDAPSEWLMTLGTPTSERKAEG
jgi:phosphoglycolate phosphatase